MRRVRRSRRSGDVVTGKKANFNRKKTKGIEGDHLIQCDISGQVCLRSEASMTWRGLLVSNQNWDPKHPQLTINVPPEDISVLDARPFKATDATDGPGIGTVQITDQVIPLNIILWDGSNPVTFLQGDAIETGVDTLFAFDTDLAKSTKDRVIAGNPGFDTGGTDIGAAHIYTKGASSWNLEQTLQRSGAAAGDDYGSAVAMNGDGTIVAVANDGNVTAQTNVEIWTRLGTTWSRVQTITTSYTIGTLTNLMEMSSDGGVLCLRNNSSSAQVEAWRWNGSTYSFEFRFTEASNTNSFAESFYITEDGLFFGAPRRNHPDGFLVWENTTGSTWVQRSFTASVGNSIVPDDGFGMSGDAEFIAIATTASGTFSTWQWDGATYQQISTNLPVTLIQSARMSSDGFQIAAGDGSSTANTDMYEGDGSIAYTLSSTQIPDDPEQTGTRWAISYDGEMILVGNQDWKTSNGNQGRFFTMEV